MTQAPDLNDIKPFISAVLMYLFGLACVGDVEDWTGSLTGLLTPQLSQEAFVFAAILSRTLKAWYHSHFSAVQWHRSTLHRSTSCVGRHPDSWLFSPTVYTILSACLCRGFWARAWLSVLLARQTEPIYTLHWEICGGLFVCFCWPCCKFS